MPNRLQNYKFLLTSAQDLAEICYKKLQIANFSAGYVRKWWKFSNFGAKTKNDRTMVNDMETNKGEIVMYQPDEASSEHLRQCRIEQGCNMFHSQKRTKFNNTDR